MSERERSAGAGTALAAALLGLALAWPAPAPDPCAAPVEWAAAQGRSRVVACDRSAGAPLRGAARRLFGLPLDPNTADALSLETLPGIGPARARAIVEARQRRPFERTEDLGRVHGIGPRTLERLVGLVAVEARRGTLAAESAEESP
jgi:competence ComEA-like helix-hairpin-helix protein